MEVYYSKDVDPARLNGFAATYEAMRKAAPLVIVEAYRMAKAYNTPLVDWDAEKQCVIYIDPNKYSLDDIRNRRFMGDPSIYQKPEASA